MIACSSNKLFVPAFHDGQNNIKSLYVPAGQNKPYIKVTFGFNKFMQIKQNKTIEFIDRLIYYLISYLLIFKWRQNL